jgi:hypothetical protein
MASFKRKCIFEHIQPVIVEDSLRFSCQAAENDMPEKHFPKGLDGRMQDRNGQIRQKRNDTHVETLRKTYGDDFAAGIRSDAHLKTVLERAGVDTLDQYLKLP